MTDTMNFPKLPEGYRWEVEFTTLYNIPRFVAKIKKRRKIIAEGTGHINAYTSPEEAPAKAARDAHKTFLLKIGEDKHSLRAREYQEWLNHQAHK